MLKILGRTENIEVCYPTIDTHKISQFKFSSKDMRKKMGISESTFIWCMSGSADSNKNPVRFVEIAHQLLERNYDCHFLWLGNNPHSGLSVFAKKYANFLNIDNKITWTGILKDGTYYDYLNLADGLVLTSSRESFSIVSLEALYFKKPIVSFNCGGIREIINDKLGYVIDSWNTIDLVEVMMKIMINNSSFDPDLAKITSEKYAIEPQVDKWKKIMTSYFI
jgi:glycosyltransferase involved in cell wall biosynthesis